jgi:multidrug resistance efflux pump
MDEVEVGHDYTKVRLAEFDILQRENAQLKAVIEQQNGTTRRYQFALADTEAVLMGAEERIDKLEVALKALEKPETFSPAAHGAHVGDVFNRQRIEAELEVERFNLAKMRELRAELDQTRLARDMLYSENVVLTERLSEAQAEIDVEEKRFNQIYDDYAEQAALIETLAEALKCFAKYGHTKEALQHYEKWRAK